MRLLFSLVIAIKMRLLGIYTARIELGLILKTRELNPSKHMKSHGVLC